MKQMVVGGFLFLRYLCPALVTPEGYGLKGEQQSCQFNVTVTLNGKTRRTLILISKVIQNLANGVEFEGQKEPYMMPLNTIVLQYTENMTQFEDDIAVLKK